ncbi:cob(I)yrinic acid a,c-diamide adenosyltransferase [Pontixanthobacter gangjinensis]|uniref:Corrinoid adenosyltransferase n=1 Tax=Pontixanthobacter gangjinensis TaxID=1028742 RepID=A0A6I4SL14_9SPHN|nr:cob(I)yrinic acid a,c-diamide adenosyltransferase [Pontixanthobacter gangjinensis]MXO55477.1 cob(I)yrinic acid a,c-diamide adenosyltransferase [Pontixanthobacter gangjinensis]
MVKLNKIYTRTGDDGSTGLVDGSRLAKHAMRMAAIGAVDEANSVIGLAATSLQGGAYAADVERIQNDMFDLGADLATPLGEFGGEDFEPSEMVLRIVASQVEWLEERIDALNAKLEPLTSFILPGGTEAAARMHIARASVRGAERAMTAMAAEEPTNPQALAYINRLSDYLFVLARVLNDNGTADVKWVPGSSRTA